MGIGHRIEGIASSVKGTAQNTSIKLTSIFLRVLTGLILGYVLGLMAQEILEFGNLIVLFFVIVFTAFFYRISVSWSVLKIFMFDVFCALVLQILKMYILLAP
jgi:Na+/H+ antiporter NhaC